MQNYKHLPLLLAYVLYPVVMIASRYSRIPVDRNWIDVIWLLLGAITFFVFVYKTPFQKFKRNSAILMAALLALLGMLVVLKFGYVTDFNSLKLIPYMMEFKPIFYLFISLLLIVTFGNIELNKYISYGSILGGIVILDFVLGSYLSGSIVLPQVSGERNYDACLLVIGYIVTLANGNAVSNKSKFLIITGLILTFSRTAIAASVVITLFVSDFKPRSKIIFIVISILAIISSFLIRGLPLDSIHSMDRYWMWDSTIRLFINHPDKLFFGFPVGESLPVTIPHALNWLWNEQEEAWGLNGIYAYNMHAFWLRLTITWGWLGLTAVMLFLFRGLFYKNRIYKGLCILVFIEGVTMGVFYLSNVSIPLLLAFMTAYKKKGLPDPMYVNKNEYMHN